MARFSAFIVARDFRFPPRSTVTANRSSRHCPVLHQFVILCVEARARCIVNAGWSWGSVSEIDSHGRTIWIVDAHRDDGRRSIVRADELLSAFVELERQVLAVTFISHLFMAIRAGDQ